MSCILEFREIEKSYDTGVRALDLLSMCVPQGSIFGFIGLNGAGKTTAIRILAGLLKQDSGRIILFGTEVGRLGNEYKRNVGFVLDQPACFDWMSPAEWLHFAGAMYGLPKAEITSRSDELTEFFDLSDKKNDPISTLSTGMKKKISLASAVIHSPRLIILDEPLEGIDALAASSIKETLTMMAAGGATILITSHVLDTVEQLCTDIAVIHKGKNILQCRREEIRTMARGRMEDAAYSSLEELFVDLVSDREKKKHLSWL